jgi:hypothetical protein
MAFEKRDAAPHWGQLLGVVIRRSRPHWLTPRRRSLRKVLRRPRVLRRIR